MPFKSITLDSCLRANIGKQRRPSLPLSPVSGEGSGEFKKRKESCIKNTQPSMIQDDYREETIAYMKSMEKTTLASPKMMDLQPELEWYMRPYLIDFILEVHSGFHLQPVTLYLTVNLIDRYTSKRVVFKKHYQLLGCAALWVAAKFEEPKDRVPTLKELSTMCCDSYREEMFVQMESHIIKTLDWMIGHPTAYGFLQMMTVYADLPENVVILAQFFTELALYHRDLICLPSTVAEASLFLAHSILQPKKYYMVSSSDTFACINTFHSHLDNISNVILKKYSHIGIKKIINDYLSSVSSTQNSLQVNSPHTPSPHKHSRHSQFYLCVNHTSETIADQFGNIQEIETGLPTPPVDDNQCNHYTDVSPMT